MQIASGRENVLEYEYRGAEAVRELRRDESHQKVRPVLIAKARLRQATRALGSGLPVSPIMAGEFNVELAWECEDRLWKITDGVLGGLLLKESRLLLTREPVDPGYRRCSQCGRGFVSGHGFSHCVDHIGMSVRES